VRELKTVNELKVWRHQLECSVGLVPTMGYLHEGHLSLIQASTAENEKTIVSIFVNPAQFNQQADFDHYPRDLHRDLELCRDAGVDAVFMPTAEELYPESYDTWINLDRITRRLEGEHRPGHFRGVATVVFLLFQLSQADTAYFGEKDAQQLLVVKRMAADLHLQTKVKGLPTVREADGLAMSSRNARLSQHEREVAPALYRALQKAKEMYDSGIDDPDVIHDKMVEIINSAELFTIDYISLADIDTLEEQQKITPPTLISLAAFIGDVRLIDNIIIGRR
jgi:pantoate--beta-alanine ligase